MSKSVFITGANRGIGLGLTKEFLKSSQIGKVFATTRNVGKSVELQALSEPRLVIIEMDTDSDADIQRAVEQVSKSVGSAGLDYLINNAGAHFPVDINAPIKREEVRRNLEVNAISKMVITVAFKDLLHLAAKHNGHSQVIQVTSGLGSFALTWGALPPRHFTAYNMSKSALNMFAKCVSKEWKETGIRVTLMNPGWVATDLTKGDPAPMTVDQSTPVMVATILGLTDKQNGGFFEYNGEELPL